MWLLKRGETMAKDPELSKIKILKEAEKQFAENGLQAASVNVIARNAEINKRMIYHYFGSKEALYKEVLKSNFLKIYVLGERAFGKKISLQDQVKQVIREYYYFLWNNPYYVKIMAWEEISGGAMVREVIPDTLLIGYERIKDIYEVGVSKGVFNKGIDLNQLILSINALCFVTFTRKEMLEVLWGKDINHKLEERLEHIYDLVLNGICC